MSLVDGILLVDKTNGPTSHDVVGRLRRLLRTRAIGHAGTLDPMATGLLVIGVGEGTKLLAALTDDDKAYEATIRLGIATDTLDAQGTETASAPIPEIDVARVEAAVAAFLGVHDQVAPVYSAIKRDGETLHARARRGEVVEAPVREVVLREAKVLEVTGDSIRIVLDCGKGFYVRSFARDLAEALGTVGHLTSLRRTRSGGHSVERAIDFGRLVGDEGAELARGAIRSMVDSLGTVPAFVLDEDGLVDAACGRPVARSAATGPEDFDVRARVALVTADGALVALARAEDDHFRVERGFVEGQSRAPKRERPRPEEPCDESPTS